MNLAVPHHGRAGVDISALRFCQIEDLEWAVLMLVMSTTTDW